MRKHEFLCTCTVLYSHEKSSTNLQEMHISSKYKQNFLNIHNNAAAALLGTKISINERMLNRERPEFSES